RGDDQATRRRLEGREVVVTAPAQIGKSPNLTIDQFPCEEARLLEFTMTTAPEARGQLWAGRVISAVCVLFLLMDGVLKLVNPEFVIEASERLGYPPRLAVALGVLLLACTMLYLIPWTSVLGAVLLTGYLGGAVASHVRISDSWFPCLFPVIFGSLVWSG